MSCLRALRRARYVARIATLEAQLAVAYTTMSSLLTSGMEEYRFDSGDGRQHAKNVDIDSLNKLIRNLEAQIDWLYRKLGCGGGVSTLNLRRKQNSGVL